MTIESFYNSVAEIYTNSIASDESRDGFTLVGSEQGALMEVTDRTKLYNADNFGNEFVFYTSVNANIKANNRLIIAGKTYNVAGVQDYIDMIDDNESHKKIILTLTKK